VNTEQFRRTKQVQHKLLQNKATIAEAEKGKSMVIIYKQDLNQKVYSFIINNNIAELKADPIQKFQRIVQNPLKQCKNRVDPTKRKYIIQMNPQAPKLKAKIKIHKPDTPIRPVINSIYAPTHKLAKYVHQKLHDLLNLKYEYIINTRHLADNIKKLKLKPDHKTLTMDIKDLYVNLPINQTLNITKKLLQNNRVDEHALKEIMSILTLIMNQNYF
jgi:thermostable 8-oxoguanine DNA glycosylase